MVKGKDIIWGGWVGTYGFNYRLFKNKQAKTMVLHTISKLHVYVLTQDTFTFLLFGNLF